MLKKLIFIFVISLLLSSSAHAGLKAVIGGGATYTGTSPIVITGTAVSCPTCATSAGAITLGTSAAATNPSRTSDATTGLFSPAVSTVAVATAGGEGIILDSAGDLIVGMSLQNAGIPAYVPGLNGGGIFPHINVQSADGNSAMVVNKWTNDTAGALVGATKNRANGVANIGTPVVLTTGDNIVDFTGQGYSGATWLEAAGIYIGAEGTIGTTAVPGNIRLQTANSSGASTEAMRVNSSQAVMIGTTAPSGSNLLTVNGGIATIGGSGGSITLSGSSTGTTILQASANASGTLTYPAATDTLTGKATTDTLTNKTYDTAGTGNSFKINGTAITAVTGTGSVVLATSPTLVTPALGTPASGVMTNVTGTASGLTSGITNALASATTTVNVSSATAPTSGQVLTATSGTAATWQTASGGAGGGGTLNYSDNGVTVTANTYFIPIGGGGVPTTTEANVSVAAPAATTVSNLQVSVSAAPGAGNSYTITLRDGGADKAVTCAISGASATTCSDVTHSFNVAAADLVDWKFVSAGTIVTTPTVNITAANGTSNVGATSVSFTGGLISVATPTTTPALTVAGTSGGVPYFASSSTWASSAALTAHGVVVGGGAGTAPTSTAAGTSGQVLTSNGSSADPTFQPAGSGTAFEYVDFPWGPVSSAGSAMGIVTGTGQQRCASFNVFSPGRVISQTNMFSYDAGHDVGHYAMGILNSSGNVVTNGTSTTLTGASTQSPKTFVFSPAVTLTPGQYAMCWTSDNTGTGWFQAYVDAGYLGQTSNLGLSTPVVFTCANAATYAANVATFVNCGAKTGLSTQGLETVPGIAIQ